MIHNKMVPSDPFDQEWAFPLVSNCGTPFDWVEGKQSTPELRAEITKALASMSPEHWTVGNLESHYQLAKDAGIYAAVSPPTLSGLCLGAFNQSCKVGRDKFTCRGCGKVHVPTSYVDPKRCKVFDPPEWWPEFKSRFEEAIREQGGPSKIGPLTTLPNGEYRVAGTGAIGRIKDGGN